MARRRWWTAVAAIPLLVTVGCGQTIPGAARPDPVAPMVSLGPDGFALVAGFSAAPARIEIFTEPQCPPCARLQKDHGEEIRSAIGLGLLQVTYRPLMFLDTDDVRHSDRVANALFLAGQGKNTPAVALQKFIEELWANQDPGGPGPTDDEMATMARDAGIPADHVQQIADAESGVDLVELENTNSAALDDFGATGTPTVRDLVTNREVELSDSDWLRTLLR